MVRTTENSRRLLWGVIAAGAVLPVLLVLAGIRAPVPTAVTVLDPAGQPAAGVGVWIEWRTFGLVTATEYAVSDAAGIVDLRPYAGLGRRVLGSPFATPNVPGVPDRWVGLRGTNSLQVPEHGTVEVSVVRADGTPYVDASLQKVGVQMEWVRRIEAGSSTHVGHQHIYFDPKTRVRFQGVAVDAPVRITSGLQGVRLAVGVRGPAAAGATRQVVLRLPEDLHELVGRCSAGDGQPLADQRLGFALQGAGLSFQGWTVITDAHGGFRFLLQRRSDRVRQVRVRLTRPDTSASREVSVELPATAGTVDLGTVRFSGR